MSDPQAPIAVPLTKVGVTVATAVACVVPVPFVGELLIGLSRRALTARLLARHGRTARTGDLKPYYGEP